MIAAIWGKQKRAVAFVLPRTPQLGNQAVRPGAAHPGRSLVASVGNTSAGHLPHSDPYTLLHTA